MAQTAALKRLARALVDLRATFERDGKPDWAGRSWDYRQTVTELLNKAKVKGEERRRVTALIRYHTGNELRSRLSEGDLADAGLVAKSPKERALAYRNSPIESGLATPEEWLEGVLFYVQRLEESEDLTDHQWWAINQLWGRLGKLRAQEDALRVGEQRA